MKKILIQFPTRQRPERFKQYLFKYLDFLGDKENYQVHVSCDVNDETMNNDKMKKLISFFPKVSISFNENKTKIQAYNVGVTELDWDILIAASDDMWPLVKGYDNIIRKQFEKHFPDGDGVLHFNDGISADRLSTFSIMGRKYYDRFHYVYNMAYKSFYCDNEFTDVAKELGKLVYTDRVIVKHMRKGLSDELYDKNHKHVKSDRLTYNFRKGKRLVETGRKVISFSIFGDNPKYTQGAIENAKLQPKIYPGWKCRFYIHTPSVPKSIIRKLSAMNCELFFRTEPIVTNNYPGMFWRIEVFKDKEVGRFIVRDTDSRLSEREKVCVDEWIESKKNFHIIRDHPHHGARIMGGMWGATRIAGGKFSYNKKFQEFKKLFPFGDMNKTRKGGGNQHFLAEMIYPLIKDDVIIHDNYHFFKDETVLKIPNEKVNDHFIGEIINV